MAVDTYSYIITYIQTDYANERNSHHLLDIVEKTGIRLKENKLRIKNVLAHGGFGSGLNGPATGTHRLHAMLEYCSITAYIP